MAKQDEGFITGRVTDAGGNPIHRAEVVITIAPAARRAAAEKAAEKETDEVTTGATEPILTDRDGFFRSGPLKSRATYDVSTYAFGIKVDAQTRTVEPGCECDVSVTAKDLDLTVVPVSEESPMVGKHFAMTVRCGAANARSQWRAFPDARASDADEEQGNFLPLRPGALKIEHRAKGNGKGPGGDAEVLSSTAMPVNDAPLQRIGGNVNVALSRTAVYRTEDQALWAAIRDRTNAISFHRYRHFLDRVLGIVEEDSSELPNERRRIEDVRRRIENLETHLHGVGAYHVLKTATEAFLLLEAGVRFGRGERAERRFPVDAESNRLGELVDLRDLEERLTQYLGHPRQLPYIKRVVRAAFAKTDPSPLMCDRVLTARVDEPILLELIWSYWHEEGMLMQTLNAVAMRFQNVRAQGDRDPLAYLEIDPLRPLNNVLWGFIQDEPNRLTVSRRAYEYAHAYGMSLYGKAVQSLAPADSRSKFVEAFHNLLHLSSVFYKEDNDTTVIADGYPLLNALKEVHLLLAQGAHNQFGDLPWTARVEMMLAEWMLARPEMRDFIQARVMVPYKEAWMPQVDTMKTLQGWSDVTVTHFRDLGVYGEQILLGVRYGDWIGINDEDSAKNWARYWRPEIQGYLHAYRAVTGIDLTNPDSVDATVPAVHLQKRLSFQQQQRIR
jgi:hypothetical protein